MPTLRVEGQDVVQKDLRRHCCGWDCLYVADGDLLVCCEVEASV